MQPELRFALAPETAQKLDDILTAHGMRFIRLTREQFDVINPAHPHCRTPDAQPHVAVNGLLEHHGREFPCSLRTTPKTQALYLTPNDLEDKWSAEVIEVLEHAFPQPARGAFNRRSAERTVDKGSLISSAGCILVLLILLGILFLALVGALSLFR